MAEHQDRGLKRNLGYASASDMSTGENSRAATPPIDGATSGTDSEGMLHPGAATKTRALQSLDDSVPDADAGAEPGRVQRPSFSDASSVSIAHKANAHIILPMSAAHAVTTGAVSSLRRCVVDMSVPTAASPASSVDAKASKAFAGMTLRGVRDSLVVCGRVDGPAHVTGLTGCVVVVQCRQFRMHQSSGTTVYLDCSSRPIIEDCEEVRFAPLPEAFRNKDTLEAVEEDSRRENLWDQVDDFKWLKNEPNPHWSVLPESERVPDEVWKNKLPGGPGVGMEDILKAVGI